MLTGSAILVWETLLTLAILAEETDLVVKEAGMPPEEKGSGRA